MTTSGIYIITCQPTNKRYIGSGINLSSRKSNHFKELERGKHFNTHLQRAYDKHGRSAFVFEVLEYCAVELLEEREQFFIDTMRPEFNQRKDATSNVGVKRPDLSKRNQTYRGNDKAIYRIDPNTLKILNRYDSVSIAERKLKLVKGSLNKRRRKYFIYGQVWMLADEYNKDRIEQFVSLLNANKCN